MHPRARNRPRGSRRSWSAIPSPTPWNGDDGAASPFVSGGGFELVFELRVEFAVDQDEGDEAWRIGAIAPGMIGAALHDNIACLYQHLLVTRRIGLTIVDALPANWGLSVPVKV